MRPYFLIFFLTGCIAAPVDEYRNPSGDDLSGEIPASLGVAAPTETVPQTCGAGCDSISMPHPTVSSCGCGAGCKPRYSGDDGHMGRHSMSGGVESRHAQLAEAEDRRCNCLESRQPDSRSGASVLNVRTIERQPSADNPRGGAGDTSIRFRPPSRVMESGAKKAVLPLLKPSSLVGASEGAPIYNECLIGLSNGQTAPIECDGLVIAAVCVAEGGCKEPELPFSDGFENG